jgi:hypothetical protein
MLAWAQPKPCRQVSASGECGSITNGGYKRRGVDCAHTGMLDRRRAMPHMAAKQATIGVWLQQMLSSSHPNVVVVALAAKLARIVWAVLRH